MRIHPPMSETLHKMADDIANETQLKNDMAEAIATRIDRLLKKKAMSHKDLALLTRHSQGEVSRWLSGTHNFTLATLAKISVALGENILDFSFKPDA